ncbi:glycosyltransferase family 4 protein [Patescibacteria group bacterium]|nr:glycosyltransferase family 4 protein [Patescibacteria group bacterium]MBU2124091.1 glycosyltransferase family 4 protein [Patescibacteria group bacterium]MBU2194946.1 glycosyltransferase family 4 protein [Patescibacteria group bacterium]MBU2329919.1 glycosyltransferase family 4 protein [Patescibacteria group bacterium]
MNALFVSSDQKILDETSSVHARMQEYAKEIGILHIVLRGKKKEVVSSGALTVHSFPLGKIGALLFLPKEVRKLIKDHSIEVVSAQDPFEHGWIALKAVQGTNAALHLQVHTDFLSPWFTKSHSLRSETVRMPLLNKVRRHIADRVIPKAQGIRVVSERIGDSLREKYGAGIPDPVVIPIEVPKEMPAPIELTPHNFTFALMAASRLEPEKRIEDILTAIAQINARYPSVGLVLVGGGSERKKLEAHARRLKIENKVVFLGEKSPEETRGLMQSAHAFIQASAYEGYGRSLVEAALAGIPIITTDVGIVGEVFEGYTEVLSAPVADPAALAVHIVGLVEDQQARKMLAIGAKTVALRHLEASEGVPARIAQNLAEATKTRY